MPNRILKESICTSCEIDQLTPEQESFWYRLIVNCDDFGRMDARADVLWSRLYPLRLSKFSQDKVNNILAVLSDIGLIQLYAIDIKRYLMISTWEKHQQIRAKRSKYPDPINGNHLQSSEIICNHLKSNVTVIQSNPIQSNPGEAAVPFQEIVDLYHKHCPGMVVVKKLNSARRLKIKTRWQELKESLEEFEKAFTLAGASSFMNGQNDRHWRADFDWFIANDSNINKVLEGKYKDKETHGQRPAMKEIPDL